MSQSSAIASRVIRVSFGLSLLLLGLSHYMFFDAFSLMVTDNMAYLTMLGTVWAMIYPALLIVGGVLFVIGQFAPVATWVVGVALGSVPVGLLLKPVVSGSDFDDAIPFLVLALGFILVYLHAAKAFPGEHHVSAAPVVVPPKPMAPAAKPAAAPAAATAPKMTAAPKPAAPKKAPAKKKAEPTPPAA